MRLTARGRAAVALAAAFAVGVLTGPFDPPWAGWSM